MWLFRSTAVRGTLRSDRGGRLSAVGQDDLEGRVDRDVTAIRAEIRDFRQATTASFNALRQDFVDFRAQVDRRFEQVDRGFMEMRGKLDATATGQQRIVELLESLINQQGR